MDDFDPRKPPSGEKNSNNELNTISFRKIYVIVTESRVRRGIHEDGWSTSGTSNLSSVIMVYSLQLFHIYKEYSRRVYTV